MGTIYKYNANQIDWIGTKPHGFTYLSLENARRLAKNKFDAYFYRETFTQEQLEIIGAPEKNT